MEQTSHTLRFTEVRLNLDGIRKVVIDLIVVGMKGTDGLVEVIVSKLQQLDRLLISVRITLYAFRMRILCLNKLAVFERVHLLSLETSKTRVTDPAMTVFGTPKRLFTVVPSYTPHP